MLNMNYQYEEHDINMKTIQKFGRLLFLIGLAILGAASLTVIVLVMYRVGIKLGYWIAGG